MEPSNNLLNICGSLNCAYKMAWALGDALENGNTAAPFYAEAARGIAILLDYIEKDVIAIEDALPAARLPVGFGFMIAHPVATVAPMKLEEYQVHNNPPGISGDLVEGRLNYDAFVLKNKAGAILYQAQA